MQQNIVNSWRITWFSLQESYDLLENVFSSKTMTQSRQRKLCGNGLETTRGLFWKWLSQSPDFAWSPSTWQRWSSSTKRNWVKLQHPDVENLIEIYLYIFHQIIKIIVTILIKVIQVENTEGVHFLRALYTNIHTLYIQTKLCVLSFNVNDMFIFNTVNEGDC